MKTRLKPFEDTVQGPIFRQTGGAWTWINFPAIGEEVFQEDYPTRQAARLARREQKPALKGSGKLLEYKFWRG